MKKQTFWSKDYILVLLLCCFASFTNSIFATILPVYVLDSGGSNADTGLMMTGLTIAGIITRVTFGPLIDRWGRRKMLLLGSGLYVLNALGFCFTHDMRWIFVLRICHGISQGIYFPVPPTIVADVSPKDKLIEALSFFGVSSSITFAIAPPAGLAIYSRLGASTVFLTATAFALIAFVAAIGVKEHYEVPAKAACGERKKLRFQGIFEVSILTTALISMFIYLGNSAVANFLTPCGLARGITQISLFFTVYQITMIVTRLLCVPLTRSFSSKLLIVMGIVFCTAGTLVIAWAGNLWLMLAAGVLIGVGMSLTGQLLQANMFRSVPNSRRGVANSSFMLLGDIGNGAGASIWGLISAGGGYSMTYILAAGVTMVSVVLHLFDGRKARKSVNVLSYRKKIIYREETS